MLSPKQKLHLTSGFALFLQIFSVAYAFVLPRFFLECYGSAVNGLISSITQFLGFIALAECGVGAVVQSALYKPLSQKNNIELSKIIVSAEHFFRNIAKILLFYTFVLGAVFPCFIDEKFDFFYTAGLIFIISISSFAQYYFGITYRLLLNSDQFGFVPIILQIVTYSLNLVSSIFLMKQGCSVHVVKFVSSLVFLVQPIVLSIIAHRWYHIDWKCGYDKTVIPQKWNGLAQHISAIVLQSCGITVLTLFSSLEIVSVYAIYFLVICGLRNLISSLTSGYQALLGSLYAANDYSQFKETFLSFEKKMHIVCSIVFPSAAVLIVPFVGVYTNGVNDADYIQSFFGVTFTIAWGFSCLQLPYRVVTFAVGHFRETQNSSFIESGINIILSTIFVFYFDLLGVVVGTFAALFYRFLYLSLYVQKNLIQRTKKNFFLLLLHDFFSILLFVLTIQYFFPNWNEFVPENIFVWCFYAAKVCLISIIIMLIMNFKFFKNYQKDVLYEKISKR